MPKVKTELILGIDPGTATTGYGLISKTGAQLKMKQAGIITTKASQQDQTRLQEINNQINQLIKKLKPNRIAVEQLFFCNNAKSAMSVGMARGVIILACAQNNIKAEEFTPLQVKQALCGYGKASKKQIQIMVKNRLNLQQLPQPDDLADALAIAICSAQTKKNISKK